MLIHSVTPPHLLIEQPAQAISQKTIDGGYVEGYDTPQGFCLSRVFSTNPADYLRRDYQPGEYFKGK